MIKKTTTAIFNDGDYAGEYDWEGGIPLSVGEQVSVTTRNDQTITYKLCDKKTILKDDGVDQIVVTTYRFEQSS